MRKFILKSTSIILLSLCLVSCTDNKDPETVSESVSDTFISETTVAESVTEDVSEDTASDTDDISDAYNSFDSDEYLNKIMDVYSRPVPQSNTKIENINDVTFMCSLSAIDGNVGPIGIVPAKYTVNGTSDDIYFIFLGGTEFKDGQATDFKTDILSGFGKDNDYLQALINTVKLNVPKDSKLFVSGLSLGGMVAQQFISNEDIANCYDIVNTVCIGSPLIINERSDIREGVVKRIEDKSDFVPNLSIYSINPMYKAKYSNEVVSEKTQYTNGLYAHTFSYVDEDVWKKYDVAGTLNGSATLSFDADNITYYDAPVT